MSKKRIRRAAFGLLVAVVSLISLAGCTGSVSAGDLQGMINALDGKEVIITLNDGTVMRLTVDGDKTVAQVQDLLGKMVAIKVDDNNSKLESVKELGEDQTVSGTVSSILDGAFVVGGQTFKVNANTAIDGGLVVGSTAKVEFIKMADGTLVAASIETNNAEDDHFIGKIESKTDDSFVVNGQTFKVSPGTILDDGLTVGAEVDVEFMKAADGTMQAIKIETGLDDIQFSGAIESIGADSFVIGGKTIKINAATMLDNGIAVGVPARVEFVRMADGSLLAKEIEVDRTEIENEQRREDEARGREAEGEGPRGADDGGLRGDGTVDDNLPSGSGLDDNSAGGADDGGLRGDGTVDDNSANSTSGLDDGGLRGDGTVDDNSSGVDDKGGGSSSSGSGSSGSGSSGT